MTELRRWKCYRTITTTIINTIAAVVINFITVSILLNERILPVISLESFTFGSSKWMSCSSSVYSSMDQNTLMIKHVCLCMCALHTKIPALYKWKSACLQCECVLVSYSWRDKWMGWTFISTNTWVIPPTDHHLKAYNTAFEVEKTLIFYWVHGHTCPPVEMCKEECMEEERKILENRMCPSERLGQHQQILFVIR